MQMPHSCWELLPTLHLILAVNHFVSVLVTECFDVHYWLVNNMLKMNVGPYFGGKTLEGNQVKKLFTKLTDFRQVTPARLYPFVDCIIEGLRW